MGKRLLDIRDLLNDLLFFLGGNITGTLLVDQISIQKKEEEEGEKNKR